MTAWLLTWLWQGSALAAGVAVALRCVPRWNAATRHLIWCATLAAVAWLGWASSPYGAPIALMSPIPPAPEPIYIPSAPDFLISTVAGIWAAIALMSLLRVLPGIRGVYAVRDRCRPFPPSIESRLPLWLEAKARGRRTTLTICDEVPGATVLGFHRPCIAIPSALAEALTVDELDQVILHEHAHVQRRDDWARLAQTLLLSVLWIHPAALFASRALNREREMACDEWVVARTGSPKAYARCLARAAEVRVRMRRDPALVPALIGSRYELLRRVDRVLSIDARARRSVSISGAAMAVCAMALLAVQLQTVRGFSEIVEIVLPQVRAPMSSWHDASMAVPDINLKTVGRVRLSAATQETQVSPDETASAFVPDAYIASADRPDVFAVVQETQVASAGPLAAPDLSARTFGGAYAIPDAAVPLGGQPNRWQSLATPGVEIASSTKRLSLGLASAFSRAGVSLARSF